MIHLCSGFCSFSSYLDNAIKERGSSFQSKDLPSGYLHDRAMPVPVWVLESLSSSSTWDWLSQPTVLCCLSPEAVTSLQVIWAQNKIVAMFVFVCVDGPTNRSMSAKNISPIRKDKHKDLIKMNRTVQEWYDLFDANK